MPTYEYACTSCGHHLEVVQSFSDDPLTTCPNCGAPLRKVFGTPGIVLKGSGFYKTDSRSSSQGAKAGGDQGESKAASDIAPAKASPSTNGSSGSGSSGDSGGTSGSPGSSGESGSKTKTSTS